MNKFSIILFALMSFVIARTVALDAAAPGAPPDEGMWLPIYIHRLNYEDMHRKGLRLPHEKLFNPDSASLKDDIVMLNDGQCSAEIISPEGLMLTNHHCALNAIQQLSSPENNLVENGFWALEKSSELPAEGMTASFLIKIEDVTEKVLKNINPLMTESQRNDSIQNNITAIEKSASIDSSLTVTVKQFLEGNEYYLFIYKTYFDVRLAGAPPASIGKFGGDTDNWMWPRHTGDFALLRIYADSLGNPSSYSSSNIPLKTKSYLPISLKGIKQNDFAMIWGYPGTTQRYIPSEGIKTLVSQTAPAIIKLRTEKLSIMKSEMDADPITRLKYAAKYSETSNYWKYYIGQSKGISRMKTFERKQQQEQLFLDWINQSDDRRNRYDSVMPGFNYSYKIINDSLIEKRLWYLQELFMGAESLLFCLKMQNNGIHFFAEATPADKALATDFQKVAVKFFVNYSKETDRKIFASLMQLFANDIPTKFHPPVFSQIRKKFKNNFIAYADYVYRNSIFTDEAAFNSFLLKPKSKQLRKDPLVTLASSLIGAYLEIISLQSDINLRLNKSKRLYIEALRQMYPDKNFYSDANSTMRMTYGTINGYNPADAVSFAYQTSVSGIIQKEIPSDEEFSVPEKLKLLIANSDFGQYSDNGIMKTCFIANTDITGGNSGSPVINADGHLIGVAFDGNWEAMSGDLQFEPALQRTICVDIRYVLFIIDKFAGAKNFLNEIKIIY